METELHKYQQFWEGLQEAVSAPCATFSEIDDALRAFLELAAGPDDEGGYRFEYDLARCCYYLLESDIFLSNKDYVRRQFVFGLLQEEEGPILHIMAAILLFDGQTDEALFEMMQAESTFPRLVELIQGNKDDDMGLHRLLLELLCDMTRIQRLSWEDLKTVDDAFIVYLFELIEQLSDDASDPYHYPIIRVLLVLNEQYMCFAAAPPPHEASHSQPHHSLTNRIIKVLSSHGPSYRTFGENLILLLNRESALGPQLLILKLLYLLFTTPSTYEYFYTNDLHVLVDVIIRNLLDLDPGPEDDGSGESKAEGGGQRALSHTYLRVLHPLLRNTQLSREGSHYKRDEIRKLLYLLVTRSSLHFAPVDETVMRLVSRCRQVEWLRDPADDAVECRSPPTETEVAKRMLGMNLNEAGESNLSVAEVATKVEKRPPVVPAPRRRRKKQPPEAPRREASDAFLGGTLSSQVSHVEHDGGRSPFDDDNHE